MPRNRPNLQFTKEWSTGQAAAKPKVVPPRKDSKAALLTPSKILCSLWLTDPGGG
jgi:hypothetical protein